MKLILKFLVGVPSSGKSTYAEKMKEEQDYVIHASDALRVELYGNVNTFDKNGELFDELHKRVKKDLMAGKNVCVDATGINRKKRLAFLQYIKNVDCVREVIVFATPYNMCVQSDKKREKKVGSEVIKRMYFNFQTPMIQEGWDKIELMYHPDIDWTNPEYNGCETMHFLTDVSQFNKYHTLTIGQHCFYVATYIARDVGDLNLIDAGYYHDVGKFKTQSFENGKGEFTQEAHYYQHHCVSAYDSMFYLKQLDRKAEDIIEVVQLIGEHMQPHFLTEEKSVNEYKQFVGEEFWNKLMILHEADKGAR